MKLTKSYLKQVIMEELEKEGAVRNAMLATGATAALAAGAMNAARKPSPPPPAASPQSAHKYTSEDLKSRLGMFRGEQLVSALNFARKIDGKKPLIPDEASYLESMSSRNPKYAKLASELLSYVDRQNPVLGADLKPIKKSS